MSTDDVLTVPGCVFASLVDGELTVVILPGVGMGGEPHWVIPMNVVDFDARFPNTEVLVTIDRSQSPWCVTRVRRKISN